MHIPHPTLPFSYYSSSFYYSYSSFSPNFSIPSPPERRRQEVRLCRRRFRGVEEPSVLCRRRLGPGLFDDLDDCVIDVDDGEEGEN